MDEGIASKSTLGLHYITVWTVVQTVLTATFNQSINGLLSIAA